MLGLGAWQVPNGPDCVQAVRWALESGYRHIDTDYVDLYIVHWPQGGPTWAWAGMERAWELGYARSIGVSNFDAHEIDEVVAAAQVPPAVNQVQLSPFASRRALLEQCRTLGIVPEAYSPLGTGQYLADQTVNRIEANARIFDFTLSDADVAALDSLDRTCGTDEAREGKWW